MTKYDVLITNGMIVDGTGNPGFRGEVAVKGDTIVYVGSKAPGTADRVVDAKGAMVCPGFIDPHVHFETTALTDGGFEIFLRQGVTTIVNGNCGHSVTAGNAETEGNSEDIWEYYRLNGLVSNEAVDIFNREQPHWKTFTEFCDIIEEKGANINQGFLLGHGTIRWKVMGGSHQRKLTPTEEKNMMDAIRTGMEEGAMGISTGLSYIPGRYADTDELVLCAAEVAKYDGVYATHARYGIGVTASTEEAIEIGRRSGARVQVSHLTSTDPDSFAAVLKARDEGVEVAIDTIPRSTGHLVRKDRLHQFISATSDELFDADVKAALQTKEGRDLVRQDDFIFHHGMNNVFVVSTGNPEIEQKSIQQIADERGVDAVELCLDFLADDNQYTFWTGGPSRSDFPVGPYPDYICSNPLIMVGTDIIFGEPWDPGAWYELQRPGGFAHFMKSNRDGGVAVEEIVRRNTTLAAQQLRIMDRGLLRAGMKADISVIDLDNYSYPLPTDMDPTNPFTYVKGVNYVMVNGVVTIDDGSLLTPLAGRVLKGNGVAQ